MALLAYDLQLPISLLTHVRIRDVNLIARTIVVRNRLLPLPNAALDELREQIQERLGTPLHRAAPLFTSSDLTTLHREIAHWWRSARQTPPHHSPPQGDLRAADGSLVIHHATQQPHAHCRIFDRGLALLARLHLRSTRCGSRKPRSPLELFDRGPRIVRRTCTGAINAYYLWRTRYPLVLHPHLAT